MIVFLSSVSMDVVSVTQSLSEDANLISYLMLISDTSIISL